MLWWGCRRAVVGLPRAVVGLPAALWWGCPLLWWGCRGAVVGRPEVLWGLIPLVMYWVSRVWLIAHRGEMDDDPVVFATRDRVSYGIAIAGGLVLIAGTLL